MKRIINGKAYNTETATCVCSYTDETEEIEIIDDGDGDYFNGGQVSLYATRYKAFFLYVEKYRFMPNGLALSPTVDIIPQGTEEAQDFINKFMWDEDRKINLIETYFGEYPEAGSGECRFTLRMPEILKMQIDREASSQGKSTNAWILESVSAILAWNNSNNDPDDGSFDHESYNAQIALEEMLSTYT